MKAYYSILMLLIIGCGSKEEQEETTPFSSVETELILKDTLSVRALEIIGENLAFAGNRGMYGLYNSRTGDWKTNVQKYDTILSDFRAVASTSTDFFMLSAGNPALLFKTGETGSMELVYKEEGEKVFYDAMTFWNDNEGIAMGDPTENCLSIIITRDGGKTWNKIGCDILPEVEEGEAAFAASNSNIAVKGDHTWILSGGMRSRVFYSGDKGKNWKVFDTPLIQGTSTTGGYSMDFYNEQTGIILGGDYKNPEKNTGNKAVTKDGGRTWKLVAEGYDPGYQSAVRYVPTREAQEIVGVGPNGVSYSFDGGRNWQELSKESFHTIRFVDDTTAYAAGRNKIARLRFR